jgi:hypothetical protein
MDLEKVLKGHKLWLNGAGGFKANLKGADLKGADLRGADLRWAYLEGADLRGAELNSVVGDMKYIKSGQVEQWPFAYTSDALHIGCKRNSISEWFKFDDTIIAVMDDKALAFWKKWKDWFALTIELSPATPTKDEE